MALVATVLSCIMMGVLGVSGALTGWKRMLAVGAVVGAGLVGFFLFPPIELIQRFSGGDEGRVTVWRDTLKLIRAYPVFGCGLGGYESAFPRFKNSLPYFDQDYAHSDYLQGMAELGLAGFAIVATSVVLAMNSALRSIRKKDALYFGLACAGAIIVILLHSAVDFNLYVPVNATVLAWILGVTVGRAL